ncbi:alkaline phosphatase D family protein [Parvularcula lutaonensis]|uniref:Alkaline phosphatase D family protein n=1 Tax=Parvularcula lutaonensis TaxID=491923 RepID=A0ABV7MDY2_9PROT|nr:alkaline phosphatase D family protein [Parvularcula lutaonensis]GGY54114.1 alkaline phosphatase [Parvularcula lutaonensis]
MKISRRTALLGGVVGGVGACASDPQILSFESLQDNLEETFACGVASGDPDQESVVLWTRVHGGTGYIPVDVEVSGTEDFANVIWRDRTSTDASRDFTVKVVADGLEPGKHYYYRFRVLDRTSPVGRTKTLPEQTYGARFAVASCSNFPFGYFNAYDHIARQEPLDAVIHLGDYIYEYGPEGYGGAKGAALGRVHEPQREIISLEDYRIRHRQYKCEPASRRMHARHPLIAIWDDHETSNDSFKDGAENHQPATEGRWEGRKRAALQAYYEYMPVRDPQPGRKRENLYRSYSWGNFLTLTAIESRLTARTKQISYSEVVPTLTSPEAVERFRRDVLGDPSRELLGNEQRRFVEASLKRSVQKGDNWRLIANQVLFARVIAPDLGEYVTEDDVALIEPQWPEIRDFLAFSALGLPLNTDSWDGYPAARERFYRAADAAGARDLIVLTGDTHQFWANDLKRDSGEHMGVEIGTSGVTSPGPSAYLGDKAFDFSLLLRRENPEVRYTDPVNNGYVLLELDEDGGRAEFISMTTIASPNYGVFRSASFDLVKKNGTVEFAKPSGLGFKERVLYR